MRIALVIFRADSNLGGAERYAIDLGRQLASRGHDVSVLARRFGDIAPLNPITIQCIAPTRTGVYRRFLDGVSHQIEKSHFDIVHAFLPIRACDIYHAQAGLETISLSRGHLLKPTAPRRAVARMLAAVNRKRRAFANVERQLIEGPKPPITICLSRAERELALQTFNVAPDRIVALYNGIDTRRFETENLADRRKAMRKQVGIAADQRVLLFVGNDFARKGLDTAIRAIAKDPNRNVKLLVVGSDDAERYSELAAKSDALGRVLFAGHSDRVSEFLTAADALVLPSRFEPFGMVVVEAMLMGVPPIVSRACGASEVIENGVDGIVVESVNDVRSWSSAIAKVLEPSTHDALSRACLARRAGFGYEAHVAHIEKLYELARKSKGSAMVGPATSSQPRDG